MYKFVVLAALVAVASARPQMPTSVLGVSANLAVPGGDFEYHAAQRIRQQQYDLSQPLVPEVPGLAAHYAAEAQVLAAQGRAPGSHPVHAGNEARVLQAQADLIALQQQQVAAYYY